MAVKYVAVIDAGSTSSRLLIYSYEEVTAENRYTTPLKFTKLFSQESTGPIQGVEDGNGKMREYLEPLLRGGVDKLRPMLGIPPEANATTNWTQTFHKKVPLYIMATAGMRDDLGEVTPHSKNTMFRAWNAVHLLRPGDNGRNRAPNTGLRVYDIGADFGARGVANDVKEQYSFVIPAKDEGVYAWIALNHGRYQLDQMPGVVELGGKSMQIAYSDPTIPAAQLGPQADARGQAVCLFKSKYHVASRSWVLGAEFSRSAAVENKLIDAANNFPAYGIYNPCLPSHQRYLLPGSTHISTGSGDFSKCLALAESYLYNQLGTDSLPHLDIEPFTKRYYAVSSFWYTYEFFSQVGLYHKHSPYDPNLFRQAVEQYCNGSWLKPFPWDEDGARDDKFIHSRCFGAAWTMTLFHSEKGFHWKLSDQEAWKGLIRYPSTPDLKDRSSWTIGVATMVARHGSARKFCSDDENYPAVGVVGNPVEAPYEETTMISESVSSSPVAFDTPVVITPPASGSLVESAQPVYAPSIQSAGSLLPSLPLTAINPTSTFSQGLVCGVLLIALILAAYRRFTRRVPVQVPVSDEKHAIEVDEQPIMVRAHRAFFGKAKSNMFLAGDNVSHS